MSNAALESTLEEFHDLGCASFQIDGESELYDEFMLRLHELGVATTTSVDEEEGVVTIARRGMGTLEIG